MIINSAPQNEAVLSNVGEIGEFRIRNSAKAFSILSSGLYANKIRAIIRELSCNAVDSHVAAGKSEVPFSVHLPTQFEPHFAIRDYGTGLSHEQVTQIYTTYFESTKTASNEFIGALGLGSKSPFSYTDNFTVTAIQNGKKGIYSAFINEQGVPSIALMTTEETDEPNGVEVKFSVNDRWDFDKFRSEARHVYKWFKQRPVVSGPTDFKFEEVVYTDKDIIPGVHSAERGSSMAVMGNIAYPIQIPDAESTLGELRGLLNCALVIEFDIGELDFQASREGLSYIPQTVEAIRKKLEALNGALAGKMAEEAGAIDNLWEKALFLTKKKDQPLWSAATTKYVNDTNFELMETRGGWLRTKNFEIKTETLQKDFNIILRGFSKSRGSTTCSTMNAQRQYNYQAKDAQGNSVTWTEWSMGISNGTYFVTNDTKVGALERAKFHWRKKPNDFAHNSYVYVIEAFDKTKPIKTDEFFALIKNPPEAQRLVASALLEKERASGGNLKNVTIMKLGQRGYGGYYREREMVWKDAGKADSFDATKTYYYVPLSGFQMLSGVGYSSGKELFDDIKESKIDIDVDTIYGVRKADIEFIKTQKNWINLEQFLVKHLAKLTEKDMLKFAVSELDTSSFMRYNSSIVSQVTNVNSPYLVYVSKLKDVEPAKFNEYAMRRFFGRFKVAVLDPQVIAAKYREELNEVKQRYPMLDFVSYSSGIDNAIAEYVNLVDTQKGV